MKVGIGSGVDEAEAEEGSRAALRDDRRGWRDVLRREVVRRAVAAADGAVLLQRAAERRHRVEHSVHARPEPRDVAVAAAARRRRVVARAA